MAKLWFLQWGRDHWPSPLAFKILIALNPQRHPQKGVDRGEKKAYFYKEKKHFMK
jgi:hypothetical protein